MPTQCQNGEAVYYMLEITPKLGLAAGYSGRIPCEFPHSKGRAAPLTNLLTSRLTGYSTRALSRPPNHGMSMVVIWRDTGVRERTAGGLQYMLPLYRVWDLLGRTTTLCSGHAASSLAPKWVQRNTSCQVSCGSPPSGGRKCCVLPLRVIHGRLVWRARLWCCPKRLD